MVDATLVAKLEAQGLVTGAAQGQRAMRGLGDASARASRQLRDAQGRFVQTGRAARTAAAGVGTFVTAFLGIRAARAAINTLGGFEETILAVGQVSGATARELEVLTETAIQFGESTRFTSQQAADGLRFLAQTGFSVNESVRALGPSLDLAVAGQLDLARAADITSNVIKQFGLDVGAAADVADVLVATSQRSNTNVSQLAEALKFVGPIAASAGISLRDTAAAVGALGDAGIQGSEAGTQLRGALASLFSPSDSAAAALKRTGSSVEEVQRALNQGDLVGAFENLAAAGLETRDAFEIFNRRQATGALVLSRTIDNVNELQGELQDVTGSARRFSEAVDSGITGASRSAASAVEGLFQRIGRSGLGSAIEDTLRSFTGFVRGISSSEEAVERLSMAITFLGGAAGFGLLVRGATAAAAALRALTVAALTNPLTGLAAAASIAVGAFFAFRNELVTFGGQVVAVGDIVGAAFDTLLQDLRPIGEAIFELGSAMVDLQVQGVRELARGIGELVGIDAASFFDGIGAAARGTADVIASIASNIQSLADALREFRERQENASFVPPESMGDINPGASRAGVLVVDRAREAFESGNAELGERAAMQAREILDKFGDSIQQSLRETLETIVNAGSSTSGEDAGLLFRALGFEGPLLEEGQALANMVMDAGERVEEGAMGARRSFQEFLDQRTDDRRNRLAEILDIDPGNLGLDELRELLRMQREEAKRLVDETRRQFDMDIRTGSTGGGATPGGGGAFDSVTEEGNAAADALEAGFRSAFDAIQNGATSLRDVLNDILLSIINSFGNSFANNLFSGAGTGGGGGSTPTPGGQGQNFPGGDDFTNPFTGGGGSTGSEAAVAGGGGGAGRVQQNNTFNFGVGARTGDLGQSRRQLSREAGSLLGSER